VVRARRLGDRRWTLDLTSGGQIHLPSDGEVSALARLANEPQLAARLDTRAQIIDLRSQSKIAIRAPAVAPDRGG
jgi:cell division septal protein FtsQ